MPIIRSLCGQCGMGCGLRVVTGEGRHLSIAGDPVHPANMGQLCGASDTLSDMIALDGRLLRPMIDGRTVGWDRAVGHVARRLSATIARHGPGSVALFAGGGLVTEDYYVANKLIKGFIGSAHIDAPGIGALGIGAAQRMAYGEDVGPTTYEDMAQAELLLLVGTGPVRRHPLLLERIAAVREAQGMRVMLVGQTVERLDGVLAAEADLHLAVAPGSEEMLIAGLLLYCRETGVVDEEFMARHVTVPPGFWQGLAAGHDLWSVARACGCSPGDIRAFYEAVAGTRRLMTVASPSGEGDAARRLGSAIINVHLTTGRIGRPGAAPLLMGRAANGMGAREVGCWSGELAAHRDFSAGAIAQVGRFWGATTMASGAGLAGEALAQAVKQGRIKALLMLGGLPPADHPLRALLDRVPLLILTTPWAEAVGGSKMVALPSPPWIEKDGTLTAADRLISRQRHLLPLPGEAKPDWWTLTRIARAMGWHDAFHYERAAEIYREHGRLTAYGHDGRRLLNLKRHAPISNPAYQELTPWRWGEVPFDEGRFPSPDGKARLVPSWDQA